jgi:hypothetical protein
MLALSVAGFILILSGRGVQMIPQTKTLSLRQVAALSFAQRLNRWLNIIALAACLAVVAYVAGHFVAEWLWPPLTPVVIIKGPLALGYDDGRRAPYLIEPALIWLARILFLPASVQGFVAILFLWHEQPGAKRLVAGIAMMFLTIIFWLAGTLACAC